MIGRTLSVAYSLFLHGRARLIRIGAEHTAVSSFVSMRHGTRLTGLGYLAKGRRHQNLLPMPTSRIRAGKGCQEGAAVHVSTVSESRSSASSRGQRLLGPSSSQRKATWSRAYRIYWSSAIFLLHFREFRCGALFDLLTRGLCIHV
jgi:hypothetical protein